MASFERLATPIQRSQPNLDLDRQLEAAAYGLEAEHGSAYRAARQQYLRQLLSDPNQPKHVKGWIMQELNRLQRIEHARQFGLRQPGGSARNLRGVPGLDVGHKLGRHNQHHPANFRLEDARFNRARPGISRRLGLFNRYREGEAGFEAALETAAEQMDAASAISLAKQIKDFWSVQPKDVKDAIKTHAKSIFDLRDAYWARFLVVFNQVFLQNPNGWQQALNSNPAQTIDQLVRTVGRSAGLPPVGRMTERSGIGDAQVKQYHRRQTQRGVVPGRNRQTGRHRELEYEQEMEGALNRASLELEGPEPFFTKVTPIPGIGNKEGHEILTRMAMRALPLSTAEKSAIEFGVIRPDRGGQSYWNFPRSALESLKAAAQPAHSLRPTPSSTVSAALRLIHQRFADLHRRAMKAKTRMAALAWLGEALHLLQDSFSSAHVERVGGTGRIRHIRAFYIRLGWPPLSRAPHEHNAPSDLRDDVYLHGALRPEALAAIRASRNYLLMALRHLRAPSSPVNRAELRAFMNRYLSM